MRWGEVQPSSALSAGSTYISFLDDGGFWPSLNGSNSISRIGTIMLSSNFVLGSRL